MSGGPTVSVILPIYKEPLEYIKYSIESILNQTYKDFELLIVIDTGKNSPEFDNIHKAVLSLTENKMNVEILVNEKNMGLPASLNIGIKKAKGYYIARMDADDVAMPHRLERQIEFMEKNKEIDLCGGKVYYIDEKNKIIGTSKYIDNNNIITRLYAGISPIFHPTWFIRKEVFKEVGFYKNLPYTQDYEFLCRMVIHNKKIALLNEPILKCRISYSINRLSSNRIKQLKLTFAIQKALKEGREISEEEVLKILQSKPNFFASYLDGLSMYLDNLLQRKSPNLHYYLKWPIYLISPYKFKHLLKASLDILRLRTIPDLRQK